MTIRMSSRVRRHIMYLGFVIHTLKYEILNNALCGKIDKTKVKLFKKYNRKLQLLKL